MKSPDDRPCRYKSGSTSVTFGVLRAQGGRIAEENRCRFPGARVGALVVHPRRGHLDRRPRWSAPPGHGDSRSAPPGGGRSHPAPQRTPRYTHRPRLQRLGQHPPGALPHDLINQRPRRRAVAASRIRDYGKHGRVPSPAFQRQPLLETSTTRSPGRYTPFLMPFPADPQVSSIARRTRLRIVATSARTRFDSLSALSDLP